MPNVFLRDSHFKWCRIRIGIEKLASIGDERNQHVGAGLKPDLESSVVVRVNICNDSAVIGQDRNAGFVGKEANVSWMNRSAGVDEHLPYHSGILMPGGKDARWEPESYQSETRHQCCDVFHICFFLSGVHPRLRCANAA